MNYIKLDKNEFLKFYEANWFNYDVEIFKPLRTYSVHLRPNSRAPKYLELPTYVLVDTRHRRTKDFKTADAVFRFLDQLYGGAVDIIYYR